MVLIVVAIFIFFVGIKHLCMCLIGYIVNIEAERRNIGALTSSQVKTGGYHEENYMFTRQLHPGK